MTVGQALVGQLVIAQDPMGPVTARTDLLHSVFVEREQAPFRYV